MGLEEERWVVDPLGQAETLLRQFPRRLILRAYMIKPPQPKQDREELWSLPNLPAQLPGAGVGLPDFRGRLALDRHQDRAQSRLQDELVLGALRGVWQGRENLEPPGEMVHCFQVRRALEGPLAGLLPVGEGLRQQAGFRIVMRQQFGLGLHRLWKLRLQHLRNAL